MPLFEYKAINDAGKTVTGTMEAGYASAVSDYLGNQNFMPLKITEKKQAKFNFSFGGSKKVRTEDIITFTKQLVTLLRAGVPIISSLEAISEQTESQALKDTITRIHDDVEGGSNFSNALGKHPNAFDDMYVNSVRAGEAGGVLDQVLGRIGALMTYEVEIRSRVKGAMRYPIIVITGIFSAFGFLMTFVVPKFMDIFAKSTTELPLPTRILIGISSFMQQFWMLVIGAIVGGIIGFFYYIKTPAGRFQWDRLKLKIPIFGQLFLKTSMSRFAHMFETLNKSGLPILQTMEIVSKTLGNVFIGKELEKIGQGIEKGRGISKPLAESKLFPPLVVGMIAVGEQSGYIYEMLKNVYEH